MVWFVISFFFSNRLRSRYLVAFCFKVVELPSIWWTLWLPYKCHFWAIRKFRFRKKLWAYDVNGLWGGGASWLCFRKEAGDSPVEAYKAGLFSSTIWATSAEWLKLVLLWRISSMGLHLRGRLFPYHFFCCGFERSEYRDFSENSCVRMRWS